MTWMLYISGFPSLPPRWTCWKTAEIQGNLEPLAGWGIVFSQVIFTGKYFESHDWTGKSNPSSTMHYVLVLLAALLLGPAVALPGHLQFMRAPIHGGNAPQHRTMTRSIPQNTSVPMPPSRTSSQHPGIPQPTEPCPPAQTVTVTVTTTHSGTGQIPSPSQPHETPSLHPTAPRPPPTLTTSRSGSGTGPGVLHPSTSMGSGGGGVGTGIHPPGTISPMPTGTRSYVRPTLSVPYPVYF